MEVFGKKLTQARVERGLDFDQVSRETNIARRYLEALEREDFTVFPGEPYLLGFLRNYCEYLGLPSSEFITAYKRMKIQEAPIPLKELMPKRPITDRLPANFSLNPRVLVAVGAVVLLALAVWGVASIVSHVASSAGKGEVIQEARVPASYDVTGPEFRERVFAGDTITLTTDAGKFKLTVAETAPALKLDTPVGAQLVELGQDLTLDLSGDGQGDVKVFVADLFKSDPSKGADVHLATGTAIAAAPADAAAAEGQADVSVAPAVSTAPAGGKQTVLFESGSAYPVTLNATFRGYCLFRYEADRSNRDERYYQKSELLTVQAKNGIRIWASNGNSVKMQVVAGGKTVDLEVSRPGEVIVRDIKWLKDESTGRYKFVVMDID
ncbi:MAG TPA: helix-turn-helix domain-containing protein [Treponemataceae bacterium]|nr:helix-turn-helix domain-containing protein [Treponemataceae bacterium]